VGIARSRQGARQLRKLWGGLTDDSLQPGSNRSQRQTLCAQCCGPLRPPPSARQGGACGKGLGCGVVL